MKEERTEFYESELPEEIEKLIELPESTWSEAVALDPKHRPQTLDKPSTTVRREWCRWPQEAHLMDEPANRYRRLSTAEITRIQSFSDDWLDVQELDDKHRIAALGNAVPPPVAKAIFEVINDHWKWEQRSSIEICAGIGGLAIGARVISGMKHLALIEFWEPACKVLRHHKDDWPAKAVYCQDVKTFNFAKFKNHVGLLSGGPPCQPWSAAGHQKGVLDDRDLLGHLPDIVAACCPEVLVIENVPGLVTNKSNAAYLDDLLSRLHEPGPAGLYYGIATLLLNSADYGVPQKRIRLFMLGFRKKTSTYAAGIANRIAARASHCDPMKPIPSRHPWVTLRKAFEGLPDPGGWRKLINSLPSPLMDSKAKTLAQEETFGLSQAVGLSEKAVEACISGPYPAPFGAPTAKRIELLWPGKGSRVTWKDGCWDFVSDDVRIKLRPLLTANAEIPDAREPAGMVIEGDKTEVLVALRRVYGSAVKMVYIDSPRIDTLEARGGFSNSVWLSLLSQWLSNIHGLLAANGVVIVHVDDQSYHYCRPLMQELFGANNYVCTFVWQKKYGPQNDLNEPTPAQDYLVVYARNLSLLGPVGRTIIDEDLIDTDDPRGPARNEGHKGAKSGTEETKFEVNCSPYHWEFVSGQLPPGLWRVSQHLGVLWGTPLQTGRFVFRVKASDSANNEATAEITIEIRENTAYNFPSEVWWLSTKTFKPKDTKNPLQVSAGVLPFGVVGHEYSVVLKASGGKPFKISKSKPGKGRYWEFSLSNLTSSILRDDVLFGSKGTTLPSIKKHVSPGSNGRILKVLTWLPYEDYGKSEDATRHLRWMAEKGLIQSEPPAIAKPEQLLSFLIELFARTKGDRILSIGDVTAGLAATAIKKDRRFIHLAGGRQQDLTNLNNWGLPRINAARNRKEDSDLGIPYEAERSLWTKTTTILHLTLGVPVLVHTRDLSVIRVSLESYTEMNRLVEAICWVAGFRKVLHPYIDGLDSEGNAVIFVPLGNPLTNVDLVRYASEIAPHYKSLTILYERSEADLLELAGQNLFLRRIPFDLIDLPR